MGIEVLLPFRGRDEGISSCFRCVEWFISLCLLLLRDYVLSLKCCDCAVLLLIPFAACFLPIDFFFSQRALDDLGWF